MTCVLETNRKKYIKDEDKNSIIVFYDAIRHPYFQQKHDKLDFDG